MSNPHGPAPFTIRLAPRSKLAVTILVLAALGGAGCGGPRGGGSSGDDDDVATDGFRCADGTVVEQTVVCDCSFDCADGEDEADEQGCTGWTDTLPCSDESRIPVCWFCDGAADCPDGGDEAVCAR